MAEPPASENRAKGAPAPGLVARGDGAGESRGASANRTAAGAREAVELCVTEAENLAASGEAELAADAHARLGLVVAELGEDADRHIESAEEHPLAPRLLLARAITRCTPEELESAQSAIDSLVGDPSQRAGMLAEVAESWLFRVRAPWRAAQAARLAAEESAPGPRGAEVRELLRFSLAASGEWQELAALRSDDGLTEGDLGALAEAAHLLFDRVGDAAACAELLAKASPPAELGPSGDPATDRCAFYLTLVAEEVASALGDAAPTGGWLNALECLRRRAALLAVEDGALGDAQAARYELAEALAARGADEESAEMLASLSAPGERSAGEWGPRLALRKRLALEAQRGAWDAAASALQALGEGAGHVDLAAVYLSRAAEIAEARLGDEPTAVALWERVAAAWPDDTRARRALERTLIERDPDALVDHFCRAAEQGATPSVLRWAAAIAESGQGKIDWALQLREASLGASDAAAHLDLARLHARRGDVSPAARAYAAAAETLGDGRERDALSCSAGALLLLAGELAAAREVLEGVAARAPRDVVARAALRAIYRQTDRARELANALEELADVVSSEVVRASALRELALVAGGELGDKERARAALSRVLEREPDDFGALVEFGKLSSDLRDWDGAVDARQRAVEVVSDPAEAVELLLAIGDIEENRRGDEEAARVAYERAFELDETSIDALRAAGRIYRRRKDYPELLRLLRAELALAREAPRLLAIHLEIARLAAETGEGSESALAAYRDALALDPGNDGALTGVERIARADGRWDAIAEAFAAAPPTVARLATLAEAYESQGRYAELAQTLRAASELAEPGTRRADLARRLARVCEQNLGDKQGAADAYHSVVENAPEDASSRGELSRLLGETGRFAELAAVYEHELTTIPAADVGQQIQLLSVLGELRRDRLGKPADAAAAFEAILELEPGQLAALDALQQLYGELGRDRDLARILEARAEVSGMPGERASLFAKSGELAAKRGDVHGALEAYRSAFEADPTNRDVFTAFESLAYENERYAELEVLLRFAAQAAQDGRTEAFSPADLYARLGLLQHERLGNLDEAAQSYVRAMELAPDDDDVAQRLEAIQAARGAIDELVPLFERRASLSAAAAVKLAALRRAAVLAATELADEVETARLYEALLAVDPTDDQALTALESYYERNAAWDALVEVLQKRLAPMPDGEGAAALLQRIAKLCEESLRDEGRAIEFYQRILTTSPGNSEALDALARIYESTERWSDFIDVTRKQIRITTDRNAKALLYFKCGSVMEAKFEKEEDAIRYYDAAIKTSPSCLPAVHGLRDLYRRREEWPRVIQTLELEVKLWQDDKERAGVFAQIGRIYADHLGDPERALHYYESALSVDPDCVPANRALFDQYFAAEQWDLAQPLAQTLAQKAMRDGSPAERSEFYRKYGVVARMTGDLRAAAESMVIALEIQPDNIAALDELGELVRADPDSYDYATTFRELEKIYRKRDGAGPHLARVMVTQAILRERDGDLDAAEDLYREARDKAPGDFAILSSLIDLHVAMRRWTHAVDAIAGFIASEPAPPLASRVAALLRRGEIHAEGEMDPHRAIGVYREVTALLEAERSSDARDDGEDAELLDHYRQDAYYRLAHEAYLLGRYDEARNAVQAAIEIAAAPGRELSPETLARYYFYLGTIAETRGDRRSAHAQFRRAAEYDPSYPAPALALARRLAESGDRGGAESLLINAAHEAMQHGGAEGAVPLQRGLAQILLMAGDRSAAIEAFRGILAVEPGEAADRLALAEIYAVEDLARATGEIKKILERDLRFGPAYRQLAAFYSRAGEAEPAVRALSVMETLGFAEEADRGAAAKARAMQPPAPLRQHLTTELRDQYLMPEEALGPVGAMFSAIAEPLSGLFSQPPLGEGVAPLRPGDDASLDAAVADVTRLFGVEPEIFTGDRVPGGSVAIANPRPFVVLDRELLSRPDGERRFVLGRAFDSVRGSYAFLLGLTRRQREELEAFITALAVPRDERTEPTNEFLASLAPAAARAVEDSAASGELDVAGWLQGVVSLSRRAGLLACDDFNAATHAIARLNGESLPVGEQSTMGLGMVVCGADLVRYYLSDEYDQLRQTLTSALPVAVPQA